MLWPTPSCSCAHRCCCNSPTCACPKTCHLRISPQPVCMNIHRVLYRRWFCGYTTKNITSARMYEYCCVLMQGPVFTEFYTAAGFVVIPPRISPQLVCMNIVVCVCTVQGPVFTEFYTAAGFVVCHQEYHLIPYVWILLCSYAGPGIHRVLPPLVLWLYHHNPNHKQLVSSIHFPGRQTAQKKNWVHTTQKIHSCTISDCTVWNDN